MEVFRSQIDTLNYMVMGSDGSCDGFVSLRGIAKSIDVDFSTISKRLKTNGGIDCYCISKDTKTIYYISVTAARFARVASSTNSMEQVP